MIEPIFPENEQERLQELYRHELLDQSYEEEFDDIVKLASGLCDVPISMISLIDFDRQWFMAKVGLDSNETARNISFCAHAILEDGLFEVPDTKHDGRFFDNPLVMEDPNIRYYAGMPLVTERGYKLGTLCVIDRVPRQLNESQYMVLKVLSRQVMKLFELRVRNRQLDRAKAVQEKMMTIMAHDIRGPLSSLKTAFDLRIKEVISEADVRDIEGMVAFQLESTLSMLNNIVDWGQLQLSQGAITECRFSLSELVRDSFSYLLLAANTKGNQLVNEVPHDLALTGNREGLDFVLRNVLTNANKFTAGGRISVSARVLPATVQITIADTGVGIAPEVLAQLQQRNWVNTVKGTAQEKGNGIGLQLIHEYLDNIQGSISFSSMPGSGTTVVVSLPVRHGS